MQFNDVRSRRTFLSEITKATAFLSGLGGASTLFVLDSCEAEKPKIKKGRRLMDLTQVRINGELGARRELAMANILSRQDRYSIESFKSSATATPGALWWDWPGDQIGRWLSVAHVAGKVGPVPDAEFYTKVIETVLPLQKPDGSFSTLPLDFKDVKIISGNAFALRGLLDSYESKPDERLLDAAKKLSGFFQTQFEYYKDRREGSVHEFYGHCVDGLVKLYTISHDQTALDLARKIAERAGNTSHTHHSLSMYRGLLDLWAITHEEKYLKQTSVYLDYVNASRIVTGGVPESLPSWEQDEGCALADYIIVNLMMFNATGKDEFLTDAEHMLVNHFSMNQFHTGGFGHRGFSKEIIGGKNWQGWDGKFGSENPGCCSMWGAWALGNLGQYVITENDDALEVNLYPSAEIRLPDRDIMITMKTNFPRQRGALITVYPKQETLLTMRLRIPAWATGIQVLVNNEQVKGDREGSRFVFQQTWRWGDAIDVQFKTSLRLEHWPDKSARQVAVFNGPLCMGLSSQDADINEPYIIKGASFGGVEGAVIVGHFELNGKPVDLPLHAIGSDWQAPDVFNPNRWRVLFSD